MKRQMDNRLSTPNQPRWSHQGNKWKGTHTHWHCQSLGLNEAYVCSQLVILDRLEYYNMIIIKHSVKQHKLTLHRCCTSRCRRAWVCACMHACVCVCVVCSCGMYSFVCFDCSYSILSITSCNYYVILPPLPPSHMLSQPPWAPQQKGGYSADKYYY